jgi:hypothetical protein
MRVYEFPDGRLGNLIFRYFSSAMFRLKYSGASRGRFGESIPTNKCVIRVEEDDFRSWIDHLIENKTPPPIDENSIVIFNGYCQTDKFSIFRDELLGFMEKQPNDILLGRTPQKQIVSFRVADLIYGPINVSQYDIVIHLRLEDFLDENIRGAIHPESIDEVIKDIIKTHSDILAGGKICLLCNTPRMEIEKLYIDYFRGRYAIELESNDVITDFHIMKGARVLVCSLSTLSWCAAIMSRRLEKVYIPKNKTSDNQTFCSPIENSVLYENKMCGELDLREFFGIPNTNMIYMEVPENLAKQSTSAAKI